MSTLAQSFPKFASEPFPSVNPEKATQPEKVSGHDGELFFRRHVTAVYAGYMGTTVLFGALYIFIFWLYA